jgi:hypothetical protein
MKTKRAKLKINLGEVYKQRRQAGKNKKLSSSSLRLGVFG